MDFKILPTQLVILPSPSNWSDLISSSYWNFLASYSSNPTIKETATIKWDHKMSSLKLILIVVFRFFHFPLLPHSLSIFLSEIEYFQEIKEKSNPEMHILLELLFNEGHKDIAQWRNNDKKWSPSYIFSSAWTDKAMTQHLSHCWTD